jgi:hypothetical protein
MKAKVRKCICLQCFIKKLKDMLNLTSYENEQVSDSQLWNMLQPYTIINSSKLIPVAFQIL